MWTLPRDSRTFPTCSRVMTGVSRANQPSLSATYGRSLTSRPFDFKVKVVVFKTMFPLFLKREREKSGLSCIALHAIGVWYGVKWSPEKIAFKVQSIKCLKEVKIYNWPDLPCHISPYLHCCIRINKPPIFTVALESINHVRTSYSDIESSIFWV